MRLKKKLGQHLLIAPGVLKKLTELMQVKPGEVVVEIGPGTGNLTKELLKTPLKKLYLIEIDPEMIKQLKEHLKDERVEIIQADASKFDFSLLKEKELKVVGNLPYNVASLIIENTVLFKDFIPSAFYMVQKEVAKRIAAAPNCKDYGILSVLSQTYARVDYLFDVGRGNFYPAPNVDSAVIRLNFYERAEGIDDEALFRRIVRHTFNYRRKMLRNSLGRILDKTIVYSLESITLDRRPENLSVQQFKALANEIHSKTKTVL